MNRVLAIFVVVTAFMLASPVQARSQSDALGQAAADRAEAGRLLLGEGIPGLQETLRQAGAPAMTFNQETQVRSVYDAHLRALTT